MRNILAFVIALAICQFSNAQFSEKSKEYLKYEGFYDFYYEAASDKIYLEIDELQKPFLYVYSLSSGVGSNDIGLFPGVTIRLGNVVNHFQQGIASGQ